VYWADEMRVGLIGQTRRVWAPRGVKIKQAVEYAYEWASLNLAVNGVEGRIIWNWTENMKAVSIAPVVRSWAEQGVEIIVWDRAPGHRGAASSLPRLQKHLTEVLVFALAAQGLIINPKVTRDEGFPITPKQGQKGDVFHHPFALATPVIGHRFHLLCIGLVQGCVIQNQNSLLFLYEVLRFLP